MSGVSEHVNEELIKENARLQQELEVVVASLRMKATLEGLLQRLINDQQLLFNKINGMDQRLYNMENRLNLLSPGTYVAPTYVSPIYGTTTTTTGNF